MKPSSASDSFKLTASEYGKRRTDMTSVFPKTDNTEIWYPPENLADFMGLRNGAPEFNKRLQLKLFELMRHYEKDGWIVNGDVLHDTQRAHLEWGAMALCNGKKSPSSFLFLGPPGTGKTRLLAMIMQALISMQIEDLLMEPFIFATAKPYHMTSKFVGRDYALQSILHTPPHEVTTEHIRAVRRDLEKMFPGIDKKIITKDDWEDCFIDRTGSVSDIEDRVRQLINTSVSASSSLNDFVHTAALLIAGKGATVAGLDDETRIPDLLEFDLMNDDGGRLDSYAGEAAFSIPADYPVTARGSWNVHKKAQKDTSSRILLTTLGLFTTISGAKTLREHEGKFSAILCDEAMRTGKQTFQNPLQQAGAQTEVPTFAVSATSYGREWDRLSPQHSLRQSIGLTLPNVRVTVFPSREEPHYPAESEKAVDQLIEFHFTHDPLLKKQRYLMDTVMPVHTKLTGYAGKKLRERYAKMKDVEAQIHRYDSTSRDNLSSGKSEKALLEAWFVRSRKEGPNILVTTPSSATDALDLPNIENLTIGTRVSADVLYRLMGRGLHSNRHRTEGADYGVYIAVQQFSNSQLGSTPFGVIDHGLPLDEREGFEWVRGMTLLGHEQHENDAKKVKGKVKKFGLIHVPGTKPADKTAHGIVIADGGKQLVVTKSQPVEIVQKYDYPALQPNQALVEHYLRTNEFSGFLWNSASLTVTAKNAVRDRKDWVKAVIEHIGKMRKPSGNGNS